MSHRTVVALLVVGALLGGAVAVASAHDTETVEGYEVTFGGSDEPVITDERTWLEVEVVDAETDEPVEDLADQLTIAAQEPFGNETRELDVSSRFGEPGWYEAPVVFTEPGTYTVFVNGTVDGTDIELRFQKQVHERSDLEYPPREADDDASGSLTDGLSGVAVGAVIAAVGMAVAFVAGRQL